MIHEIFAVFKKNIIRLKRSRTSSLVIFLGPFLLIALIGLAFNNVGIYGITISAYYDSNQTLVKSLLQKIEGKEFAVIRENSEESCISSVKDSFSHMCIIFPADKDKRIQFYVDYSRLNLVFTVLEIISSKFEAQSKEISLGITQELIGKLKETYKTLDNNSDSIGVLINNAKELGIEIHEIKSEVDSIDVDFDFSAFNTSGIKSQISSNKKNLESYDSAVDEQSNEYLEKLDEFEEEAKNIQEVIDKQDSSKDDILETLNRSISSNNCTTKKYTKLPFKDIDEFEKKVMDLDEPTCSFLYSIKDEISETGNDLKESKDKIDLLLDDIRKAKSDIKRLKSDTGSMIDSSKSQLNDAEKQINEMENSLAAGQKKVDELKEAKSDLSSRFVNIDNEINSNMDYFYRLNSTVFDIKKNLNSVNYISPESIINPIKTEIKPVSLNKKTIEYLFPSLIVLVVVFISILLSSTLIMKEKSSKAYFRNLITPVNNFIFIFGIYLTSLVITLVQVIIIFTIAFFLFSINVFTNFHITIFLLILMISIFTLIGMIIGNIFRSEETTTISAIIISCIFLLFSNIILPIEKMSPNIASFAKINPFVVSELLLKRSIIFSSGLTSMFGDLIILFAQVLIIFLLTYILFRIAKYEAVKD